VTQSFPCPVCAATGCASNHRGRCGLPIVIPLRGELCERGERETRAKPVNLPVDANGRSAVNGSMKTSFAILIMAAMIFAGCSTMQQTTTHKDGTKDTRKASALLETIQGYADTGTNPDGSTYSTSIQNLTGDVQMVYAIDLLVSHIGQIALMASGNTNATLAVTTNLFGARVLQLRRP